MVHDHAPRIEVLAAICLFIASFTFVVAPLTSAQPTLGTGASMFLPPVTYSSGGSQPFSIALADVNGDGKHDIVVANYQSGTVGLLLGNGDGTFRPAVIDAAGTAPSGVAVADVNGDGRPDIVVANACQSAGNCTYGAISLLLGNGDGTFQPATSYNSGSGQPNQVALADLNGDGKLDVVVSIWDGSEDEFGFSAVGVFLGNADGTFQPIVKYDSGADSDSITVADVNGDGKLDLLIGDGTTVAVLLGNGDGTFQPRAEYPTIPPGTLTVGVGQVVVADINGDDKPDLIASNQGGGSNGDGSVAILVGNGDGTFQPPVDYDSGAATDFSVAVADVNGDGKVDVLAGDYGNVNGFVGVLLGNGGGTFQPVMTYSTGGIFSIALVAADVNGDGRPDVVVANQGSGTVSVLLNNTTFCTAPPVIAVSATPASLWPPNGKMIPVTVSGTITDIGCTVKTTAYAVSDEYGEVQPSGPVTLGPGGAYSFSVLLQASRFGADTRGRHYTVTVSASNTANQKGSQGGTVIVPHDQGQ
jgi:hypothetical protein